MMIVKMRFVWWKQWNKIVILYFLVVAATLSDTNVVNAGKFIDTDN